MSWGILASRLATQHFYRPRWALHGLGTGLGGSPGALYSTHQALGGQALLVAVRQSGGRIAARTWTRTSGSLSIEVQGAAERAVRYHPRGSLVELRLALDPADEPEPVYLGAVRQVGGRPGIATLQVWDLITALRGRLTTFYNELNLFDEIDTAGQTTLAADYTAGASTVDLVAAGGLQRRTGGTGAIRITPATGDPFYLTYTGVTGNQLTGVSAAGAFGTTAVDATTGDAAGGVAYLYGHPFDLVRQVLCSGSGTGPYDVLPDTWGLAVPDEVWDHDDVDYWRALVAPTTGSLTWEILVEQEVTDASAWLRELLSAAGLWLTQRQGRLTLRAALELDAAQRYSVETVTEDDLEEGGGWSWNSHDPALPDEYGGVVAQAASASRYSYAGSIQTAPSSYLYYYDLSRQIWSNVNACLDEALARLKPWCVRTPERLVLPCRGWRLAGLCEGDPIRLDLPSLRGRLSAFGQTYTDWPAIVASVTPDWAGHRTTLEVWPARELEE